MKCHIIYFVLHWWYLLLLNSSFRYFLKTHIRLLIFGHTPTTWLTQISPHKEVQNMLFNSLHITHKRTSEGILSQPNISYRIWRTRKLNDTKFFQNQKLYRGSPTYTVFTTADPTTAIFGLYMHKWGIFALVGDSSTNAFFSSPKIPIRWGPFVLGKDLVYVFIRKF